MSANEPAIGMKERNNSTKKPITIATIILTDIPINIDQIALLIKGICSLLLIELYIDQIKIAEINIAIK